MVIFCDRILQNFFTEKSLQKINSNTVGLREIGPDQTRPFWARLGIHWMSETLVDIRTLTILCSSNFTFFKAVIYRHFFNQATFSFTEKLAPCGPACRPTQPRRWWWWRQPTGAPPRLSGAVMDRDRSGGGDCHGGWWQPPPIVEGGREGGWWWGVRRCGGRVEGGGEWWPKAATTTDTWRAVGRVTRSGLR
jgi:hypothetical protein